MSPRRLVCIALVVASCAPPHARRATSPRTEPPRIPLAVTIDDVPYVGPVAPGRTRTEAIDRILAAAREHEAPITAFVTCRNAERDGSDLRAWASDGVELANHSYSHRALDDLGLEGWRADVSRCQARITDVTGATPRFFRYPFLRTGSDRALRDAGLAALGELSLRRAPVTIDTSEWALVRPYVAALRAGETERADAIAEAYVDHLRMAARRYVGLAADLGHPRAPQVLLLHANALATDHLGAVLTMLRDEGFAFVSLEDAMRHPLYAREDHYAGDIGLSWLHRIAPGLEPAWAWDAAQRHALAVRFDGERERDAFDLDRELRIRRIAEDTWIVTHDSPWPANSLLARMPDGTVLLVDTPYTDEATRALLDFARARFGPAPLVAINSHFHPDALGGNRTLAAAGVRIVGSTHTARLTREHAATMRAQLAEWLADRPEVAARFASYDPLPPSETFEAEQGLVLRFGGEEVRVVFPGAAHSPDNVVVHVPSRDVLFGGCMVMAGDRVGNLSDADVEAWPAAIERLRGLRAGVIVPGHGDRTDPGLLDHTLSLLRQR